MRTKIIPCLAAHPSVGHIREYPPAPGGPVELYSNTITVLPQQHHVQIQHLLLYLFVRKLFSERCQSPLKLLMSSFYPAKFLVSLFTASLPLALKNLDMFILVAYCCLQMGYSTG